MTASEDDSRVAIAIDVGGWAMKCAVVADSGELVSQTRVATHAEEGPDAVVDRIVDTAAELVTAAESAGRPAAAVGIVVPGLVDATRGIALYSSNIGWRDVPLAQRVADRVGLPVALDHDVRSGGLAEMAVGSAKDVPDFLFMPIGTGIAAAMVIRGAPYPGGTQSGGEIGHMAVFPDGEQCRCGARGCMEAYAAGGSIPRRYAAASGRQVDGAVEVVALAAAGNPHAVRVWDDAIDALAIGLAAYTTLLDPTMIVLGGGLAKAGEALFDPLARRLESRLSLMPAPRLVPASTGAEAGCLGATILAFRHADVDVTHWKPSDVEWAMARSGDQR